MICPTCGTHNPPGASTCDSCHSLLESTPDGETSLAEPEQPTPADMAPEPETILTGDNTSPVASAADEAMPESLVTVAPIATTRNRCWQRLAMMFLILGLLPR